MYVRLSAVRYKYISHFTLEHEHEIDHEKDRSVLCVFEDLDQFRMDLGSDPRTKLGTSSSDPHDHKLSYINPNVE